MERAGALPAPPLPPSPPIFTFYAQPFVASGNDVLTSAYRTQSVDFQLARGDTLPVLRFLLVDATGAVVDLTDAAITFSMRRLTYPCVLMIDRGVVVAEKDQLITAQNPLGWSCSYQWLPGDTECSGPHAGEVEVFYPSGDTERFPNGRTMLILVREHVL